MKKKATGLLLALSMVLSFACPAGAANLDSGNPVLLVSDLAKIDDTIEIPGARSPSRKPPHLPCAVRA